MRDKVILKLIGAVASAAGLFMALTMLRVTDQPATAAMASKPPAVTSTCKVARDAQGEYWLRFAVVNHSAATKTVKYLTATAYARQHDKPGTRKILIGTSIPPRDSLVSYLDWSGRYSSPAPAACAAVLHYTG